MARYIDADILKRATISITEDTNELYSPTFFLKIIDKCDTEDVTLIVRGKWIWTDGVWKCDKCGFTIDDEYTYKNKEEYRNLHKFCSNCGAKMEESGDN